MATLQNQTVHTGATILLKVKGSVIGRAQSLNPRTTYGTEGIYEIGTIMPQEHVHQKYEGSFTLERFLMRKEDLVSAGYVGLGEDILKKDIIDVEIINKADNKTLMVYRGCTFYEYTINVRANATVGENASVYYLTADNGE